MDRYAEGREAEITLDHAQAERALAMAARLQAEHRERLSLSELRRTAAEADIAPEFVDQAVRIMSRPRASAAKSVLATFVDIAVVALLMVLHAAIFLALVWAPQSGAWFRPFFLPTVTIAGTAGYLTAKTDRNDRRLAVGLIGVILVLSAAISLARHGFEKQMLFDRGSIALITEAAAFLVAQRLRGRADAPSAEANAGVPAR